MVWQRLARCGAGLLLGAASLMVPFGCAGPRRIEHPEPRLALSPADAKTSWAQAQHVFENRCVVCHGCYDAPCQLKLGTAEGVERGATSHKVYDPSRVLPAEPTRLGIDAHDTHGWRDKGFHPVLPEGEQGDPRASLLLRMLDLKRSHPLPDTDLTKDFTFELDRKETCTTAEHFDGFAKDHPLWGMPYALPGLSPAEEEVVVRWVEAGAPHTPDEPVAASITAAMRDWEAFLNEPSPKGQLMARYLYEHLFLASLYFQDVDEHALFRLVRSRTPVGTPIDEIPTRRPFEDPRTPRVYYRFEHRTERPLDKTLMPYPLSAVRLARFRELFLARKYDVDRLPTYEPEVAANPFRAFQAIPVDVRYRFMLEEAEFTMMGFIKGPVCRGQVALNVIEDRFWIAFLDPDVPWATDEATFLAGEKQDLDMPAEEGSKLFNLSWLRYGKEHERYVKKRTEFLERITKGEKGVTLDLVWDGDHRNPNAALTVFRHFDSATVVKGFIGAPPKTAWVVGYPLLERIHYLLVAGFDVFGNVSHQITTRLYMDFLRMEGEANFLLFLPPEQRKALTDSWYRGVTSETKAEVTRELEGFKRAPNIRYATGDAKDELFRLLKQRLGSVLAADYDFDRIRDGSVRAELERLAQVKGSAASWMPETAFVTLEDGSTVTHFTILRDSAHTNVTTLFHEGDARIRGEDALAVVPGFLGSYPNALFDLPRKDLRAFVSAVSSLDTAEAYSSLRRTFGVLRQSERFWTHSDRLQDDHKRQAPVVFGLLDYNRLEPF
jgi:Fatty acid cis/trans isomerase (CTI)